MSLHLNTTIYSIERPTNFLHKTVSSLIGQGVTPHIMHGSGTKDANIMEMPETMRNGIIIQFLSESYHKAFQGEKIIHRANRNLSQAFLMPEKDMDILILEDDVLPCKNLLQQIEAVYWLLKYVKAEKYIIALYSAYDWGVGPQSLMNYPVDKFYGLQACIFSANIRDICHRYHYERCDKDPADYITKQIVKENDIKLMATRFSLFQHIGNVTTGLGNFHQAMNFLDGPRAFDVKYGNE